MPFFAMTFVTSRKPGMLFLVSVLVVTMLRLAAPQPALAAPGPVSGVVPGNIKAQDFLNTFGVNVHFHENNYQNSQAMAEALNRLGFSRVRGTCQSAADVTAWKDLAAKTAVYFPAGLKADVLVTGYLNAPDITFAGQQVFIPQIAGLVETLEGPNEINNIYCRQRHPRSRR